MVRAYSQTFTGYFMPHVWWHQCHCDLYRIMMPRFGEAVSREILLKTPTPFVRHCQQLSLEHAVELSRLTSEVHCASNKRFVTDSAVAMCMYQWARIIVQAVCNENLAFGLMKGDLLARMKVFPDFLSKLSTIFPSVDMIVSPFIRCCTFWNFRVKTYVPCSAPRYNTDNLPN
jgi:hypothetical protein